MSQLRVLGFQFGRLALAEERRTYWCVGQVRHPEVFSILYPRY